jgi:hypothetical protein
VPENPVVAINTEATMCKTDWVPQTRRDLITEGPSIVV